MKTIPASDGGFRTWLLNFSTLLTASPAVFGLVAGDALAVATAYAAYDAAYTSATDPGTRTSATIAAKDTAKASALDIVRPLAVNISLNSAVTDENKVIIGVTVRKTTPTPIPAPVVAPVIALLSATPLVMQLQITPVGAGNKAKPAGCKTIEVARIVGTVAATDPSQLEVVGLYGKTPLIQSFGAPDQGKLATFAARYRTQSGPGGVSQAGPWSALVSFHVI